jgi:hypothetical protein
MMMKRLFREGSGRLLVCEFPGRQEVRVPLDGTARHRPAAPAVLPAFRDLFSIVRRSSTGSYRHRGVCFFVSVCVCVRVMRDQVSPRLMVRRFRPEEKVLPCMFQQAKACITDS